jgi:hypothetical protein
VDRRAFDQATELDVTVDRTRFVDIGLRRPAHQVDEIRELS